jgi:hypothetical protein
MKLNVFEEEEDGEENFCAEKLLWREKALGIIDEH